MYAVLFLFLLFLGNVKYWTQLLRILLETDLQLFSRCAQKVLFLNRNIITENHAHVACALSFSCFMQNTGPTSIRSMQKLLFTYPANIESWAMFIAAFLSRFVNKFFFYFLFNPFFI